MKTIREDLRNIAIIAHVDHGKTTLVDGMLRQARVFRENQQVAERVMDSNDLERERGITILSKNTAIKLVNPSTGQNVKINIVDTPGHADFGGEVERVMNMVDGVLLLIDSAEGPKPQTRFVLKKALELGLHAIVVINKIDRKDADPERVLNETFDLFIELGATDEQADFTTIYAIGKQQRAGTTPDIGDDLQPLFDAILNNVDKPEVDVDAPLQMLVTNLDYDKYRGLTAVGRIFAGRMKQNETVMRMSVDGSQKKEVIKYLYLYDGLERVEVKEATAGDIVAISGLEGIAIGETIADMEKPVALPAITVEKPSVRMTFGVNTSAFAGREGKWSTSRKIRERLFDELKNNVALKVEETDTADNFVVSGRGELHLAILIETMRREGYEFQVSRPEVILRRGMDGRLEEPYEEVHIETGSETAGVVIGMMGKRQGQMRSMVELDNGTTQLIFMAPSRGILGFRYKFLTATRGLGVMNTIFQGYGKMAGEVESRSSGSLVAWEDGKTTAFGLKNAEERGYLFMGPGMDVYAGMVVGEHQRPDDLDVNVCKRKHLTNIRSANKDIEVKLAVHREMSLDECIEYLADDELLEVTPKSLRIRKRELDRNVRNRETKRKKKDKTK